MFGKPQEILGLGPVPDREDPIHLHEVIQPLCESVASGREGGCGPFVSLPSNLLTSFVEGTSDDDDGSEVSDDASGDEGGSSSSPSTQTTQDGCRCKQNWTADWNGSEVSCDSYCCQFEGTSGFCVKEDPACGTECWGRCDTRRLTTCESVQPFCNANACEKEQPDCSQRFNLPACFVFAVFIFKIRQISYSNSLFLDSGLRCGFCGQDDVNETGEFRFQWRLTTQRRPLKPNFLLFRSTAQGPGNQKQHADRRACAWILAA